MESPAQDTKTSVAVGHAGAEDSLAVGHAGAEDGVADTILDDKHLTVLDDLAGSRSGSVVSHCGGCFGFADHDSNGVVALSANNETTVGYLLRDLLRSNAVGEEAVFLCYLE